MTLKSNARRSAPAVRHPDPDLHPGPCHHPPWRRSNRGAPVDLVFQSIAGSEAANAGFGVSLSLLREATEAAASLKRGTVGQNAMYFETGQGSALSSGTHFDIDQQTIETRAYAVARAFSPLLVNTVVGFIGPEYLYDAKQITRAGLEDHFCGKLLGLPMGVDVCYTNHAEADQDDMDDLMTLLAVAGVNFLISVPGSDDVMLSYQTLSYHDVLGLRHLMGRRPAPEFDALAGADGHVRRSSPTGAALPWERTDAPAARRLGMAEPDPWAQLRQATRARIGLGRAGPTPCRRGRCLSSSLPMPRQETPSTRLWTSTPWSGRWRPALSCGCRVRPAIAPPICAVPTLADASMPTAGNA